MNGWPLPRVFSVCQDAAKYPELWDRLRGLWVPSLFPSANVADLSVSKEGTNCSELRSRFQAARTSGQTGERFDGTNGGYLAIPDLAQDSGTRPVNGWTLVLKVRRFNNTTSTAGETGLCHFGSTGAGSDNHYPWTDNNFYLGMLSATRFTISPGSFDKTQWHDLTVTSQQNAAGSWSCYQNSVAISTGQNPGDWFFDNTLTGSLIGASRTVASYRFNGYIRHALLYNRVLDMGTIQRLNADPAYTPYQGVERRAYSFGTAAAGAAVPVFYHQLQTQGIA